MHGTLAQQLLWMAGAMVTAALMGALAKRLGQPKVLGALLGGILIAVCFGWTDLVQSIWYGQDPHDFLHQVEAGHYPAGEHAEAAAHAVDAAGAHGGHADAHAAADTGHGESGAPAKKVLFKPELVAGLAEFAAMLLLFMAGLEGNLNTIIQDAKSGWKVAVIGVIAPMAGGFGYAYYVMPDTFFMEGGVKWAIALFQGGVFAATSVGITAAVLGELGVLSKKYAKIIISAAVIDDVLGLVVLSLCKALAGGAGVETSALVFQIGGALLFVVILPVVGHFSAGFILRTLHRTDPSAREAIVIGWMLIYGAAAMYAGLAAIVGAYFAGVALEEIYFTRDKESAAEKIVEHDIASFITAFGPIFFVYAGCAVNPKVFLDPQVLMHGLAFTVLASVGKLVAGIAVPKGTRLLVGVGMSPRGEVGIIFASIGLASGILSEQMFGASMIMVLLTTLVTPPLLNKLIPQQDRGLAEPAEHTV